ncbi:MAG: hypothetical protein M1546_00080 [Chloroflexi bacterium]|nr:hypothetical protein [Chloroflexota bacterium]
MCAIIAGWRQKRALRAAKRERLSLHVLNLLIDTYPLEARMLGLQPAAYAGVPEGWLRRNAAGMVVMVIIGGL